MGTVKERIETYLQSKLKQYAKDFDMKDTDRYKTLYDELPQPLQDFFSLFHYEINEMLTYMNTRLNSRRYTAPESRHLLFLIKEFKDIKFNLRETDFNFDMDSNYKEIISSCEAFLQNSGGSDIPHDFQRIDIIEIEPIFLLQTAVTLERSTKAVIFPTRPIGSGSYATVHTYEDTYYNRHFAVKKARNNLTEKEYERFRIEFEEMQLLKSPYVIEVYKFDDENRQYIMEYADTSLHDYITKNNHKIDNTKRFKLLGQIFEAFIYINSKGILHRDAAPKNVLIKHYDSLDIVKIADFGLVKRQDSQLTSKDSNVKGSFNDPKLEIIGFSNYTVHHETFALTRVVHFVMTGKFKLRGFPSTEFEAFVNKGLSDNTEERYQNVKELRDAFNKIKHTL
ncbi:Protein kinase domain-containing protein [Bacillus wiedmannii]|uniref:Protein kinase domain-containing protein n=1 Tax=Bacillus wiedmannii TaxID=1890302 RepID=A0A1G6JUA9_9BACI|nr:protein kinase [Bacillus wiedmannii]SDC22287.1 Protein kinase domain-containing protein [Bacillus wiedmannii]